MSTYTIQQETTGSYKITDGTNTVGGQGTAPATGSVEIQEHQFGPFIRTDFVFKATSLAVTDAAGSGSSASLLIYNFPACGVAFLGSRLDFTSFVEGAALTTAAGDAVHILGLGSAAANAGDGALTGTEVNFGVLSGQITNSGGTGAGTGVVGASSTALNGTATAVDLYLNWSGTAATIDANSTIVCNGTASVLWCHLGDD